MTDAPEGTRGVAVVTGAFSYSGAAIAAALAARGWTVRTLTGHPSRRPTGSAIEARPLDFTDPAGLRDGLGGARLLVNTYWVRFPHGEITHATAVANSATLFTAAKEAGVERIVHVSITNPRADSPYAYFAGKAAVESILGATGVSHAIVRPAILFGGDGILINNIAWLLRHLPVFAVGGDGRYRIRPIHIDDLATLIAGLADASENTVTNAVGPERPTFDEMVRTIRDAIGRRTPLVRVPGALIPALSRVLDVVVRDQILTRDEYRAMAEGYADVDGPSTGSVRLSQWVAENADHLGVRYANEVRRHF